jgi:hypothetical protein
MGLDVYVLGALAGCFVYFAAFRVGNAVGAIWWPEDGDGSGEPEGGGGNG